ncbi:hypothetical protein PN498_14025 [Oscillatoria sp. CS-180]|uniref:hypothetical protein n=1 Tax=Oscillatoria sp. CS-180 TaxID=3021720 RepID=UPI00232F6713|nr:hypothetical protein [Oscillatoria sp. CS-180]MDB9527115.1 hypothetical protein [Oscillatoria sp. CS-180]
MSRQEFNYKDKEVVIETEQENPSLEIDGKNIAVQFDPSSKTYAAIERMAYEDYPSLEVLAKALIDNHLD